MLGNVIASLWIAIFASGPSFADEDWFRTAMHKCSGNASVQAALDSDYFTVFFERSINNPSRGHTHVLVQRSYLETTEAPKFIERFELDASEAESLQGIMRSAGESIKVPFLTGQIFSVLNGVLSGGLSGFLSGGVFSQLFDKLNLAGDSYIRLSHDVVDGGELGKIMQTGRVAETGATHVLISDIYSVPVGNTTRSYILSSCLFPVEVIVSQFKTTAGNGDKIISRDGNIWRQFDVETNRYDDVELSLSAQDEEYYYLDEIAGGQVLNQYRISMFGGPFQTKSGNRWLTLYPSVDAQ